MKNHEWERDPKFPLLHRCKKCGWGWKWDQENNFACPEQKVPWQ